MSIKLKYDPDADRMRLVIQPQGQAMRFFWLRRNQCLALLARLRDVLHQLGVDAKPIEPLKAPPARPKKDPAIDEAAPELLAGIRVRLEGESVQLLFVHADNGIGVTLKAPGVQRLQEMVATQAERAGWDPVAGIQRLKAMAQARAAIARSSQSGQVSE